MHITCHAPGNALQGNILGLTKAHVYVTTVCVPSGRTQGMQTVCYSATCHMGSA
jgi:hypothetical protein